MSVKKTLTFFTVAVIVVLASASTTEAQGYRRRGRVVVVGGYYPYYASPYWFGDPWYGGYAYPWRPYGPYGYYGYPEGSIRLEVTPRDAEVYIDGYYAGTVDDFDGTFQRLRVEPGEHEIEIYKEGFRPFRQKVYLAPDRTFRIRQPLAPLAAGEQAEPRPQPLNPPSHAAQPSPQAPRGGPGRRIPPPQQRADPRSRQPQDPRGQAQAEYGTVTIRVQPIDAEISIDGENWRAPAGQERLVIDLAEGSHTVEIRKAGYRSYATQVDVRRGETTPLNVSLRVEQESEGGGSQYHEGPRTLVSYRRLLTALAAAVLAPAASAALSAQLGLGQGQGQEPRPRIWVGGDRGFGRIRREPAKWADRADFDGQYNFCRVFYTSDRGENGGMGWWTDYPGADNNFSVRLAELTYINVKVKADGQPDHIVLRLTDPLIYRCPVLHMEDVGTVRFSDEEVESLRDYLLKGGFLYVDDFWGSLAWEQWTSEIARVLPPHKYPIIEIPRDHAILHTLYDVKEVPQVPSINRWYQMGGGTSERGADSAYVNFRAIQDEHGRLIVVMTHNTDISDTWEREGENREYFDRFSPDGYAVGVNITLYAMTH